jgi:hypothetical protein
MITGDPIRDEVQWLLQELKQVNEDLEAVKKYYGFVDRGNTVSTRYHAIDEETDTTWNLRDYLKTQLVILNEARDGILSELECIDKSYLENLYS